MAVSDSSKNTGFSGLPPGLPGVGNALVMAGKLTQKAAEDVHRKAQANRRDFITELLESGMASATDLAYTMSQAFAAPLIDVEALDPLRLPKNLIDPKLALQYRLLVLSKRSGRLIVATADPSDHEAAEKIKFAAQMGVEWVIAEYDKLTAFLKTMLKSTAESIDSIIGGDFDFGDIALSSDTVSGEQSADDVDDEDAPIVRFLNKMLVDAFNLRASDLHFEPYEYTYRVRYRIDGELREVVTPPPAIKERLASRIKVLSRLDISEKRIPQDGRMKLRLTPDHVIDFRVSTLPTLFGEKIVIRILDPSSARMGIEALGYEPEEKQRLLDAIARPYGMILVTGPTGSGKTVSLYSCLNLLNKPGVNISTAEDPSEINMPGVNQVNVNEKAGLTFATALRAFLRQDPDIIMLGEIRDADTAQMAIRSALTGHLIFSTIHTNSAWGSVARLSDMGVHPYLISDTLVMCVAQRLIRMLCPHCKAAVEADDEVRRLFPTRKRTRHYRAVGCAKCYYTGYSGRRAVYEVIPMDDELAGAARHGEVSVEPLLKARGIVSLLDAGLAMLDRNETSVEELIPLLNS